MTSVNRESWTVDRKKTRTGFAFDESRFTIHESLGFTLLETLLAITLFMIVAVSISSIFAMGTQIWRRSEGSQAAERKAILALEKMGADVRMTLRTAPKQQAGLGKNEFEFGGSSSSFGLPGIVRVRAKDGSEMLQYGKISYRWDGGKKILCRQTQSTSDLYENKEQACHPEAKKISKVRFRYWLYDGLANSYSWYDGWEMKNGLPLALEAKITVDLKNKNENLPAKELRRLFVIPVAAGKTAT